MRFQTITLEQSAINPKSKIVHAMITKSYTLCGHSPKKISLVATDKKVNCKRCLKEIIKYYSKLYAPRIRRKLSEVIVPFDEEEHTLQIDGDIFTSTCLEVIGFI